MNEQQILTTGGVASLLAGALVWLVRSYRTDVKELVDKQGLAVATLVEKHETSLEKRDTVIGKMADAVDKVGDAVEKLSGRVDRVESAIKECPVRH